MPRIDKQVGRHGLDDIKTADRRFEQEIQNRCEIKSKRDPEETAQEKPAYIDCAVARFLLVP
jgi:hypothetical protein